MSDVGNKEFSGAAEYDVKSIKEEFPILNQEVNGKPLVYFDNAATNQKPNVVIESLNEYYRLHNSNIHRGAHTLADRSTIKYEDTREALRRFLNAGEVEEIIFTKGTTESINLVASTLGNQILNEGDEVIVTELEHHSNIVPWQMVCERKKAILKVIPVLDSGELDMDAYSELLSDKTKFVSCNHASNALGTINDIRTIISKAHSIGAYVLIDGAQATSHLEIDVVDLDVDFYAGSAHKMYGPTGVGFLYGKRAVLESMPPYQGGGEMIREVSFSGTTYNDIPFKFEAGTPNIGDVIALKHAIEFIENIGKSNISKHEQSLLKYATDKISKIDKVRIIGTAKEKVGVLSFIIEGLHHFDIGMMLDSRGVAVRTGHHCTQPLMARFGIEGTVRASFAAYNTFEEIDTLIEGVEKIAKLAR
ncbi:aminotransferase class V-fold PLP-dependent enzyme [Aureibacter tunicatorum]|uniref:Cysteine desulfurase n=1 Tax=Aureibacter tunicatorum TaxID=866807 RepID=A0AAE3XQP5_9BACT|nr:cysteine desulfurase [Aureibacter tunicatorum]MDR6239644.1 cysteine desulfurase/selenocysteine lyase [Aureibacter tunicatorum]BDD04120.1 cysteine desulfurase [Aureibacter tunicatorum]